MVPVLHLHACEPSAHTRVRVSISVSATSESYYPTLNCYCQPDVTGSYVLLPTMVTMVRMGGDLQPGSLADRLLTGLGQPQINP